MKDPDMSYRNKSKLNEIAFIINCTVAISETYCIYFRNQELYFLSKTFKNPLKRHYLYIEEKHSLFFNELKKLFYSNSMGYVDSQILVICQKLYLKMV